MRGSQKHMANFANLSEVLRDTKIVNDLYYSNLKALIFFILFSANPCQWKLFAVAVLVEDFLFYYYLCIHHMA